MKLESTSDFLNLLRSDETLAINLLFKTYYSPLCKIVNRMVNDKALAEDLIQDIFLKFWQKRNHLIVNTSLKNYLHRMAINHAIDYLRKERNKPNLRIESTDNLFLENKDQTPESKFEFDILKQKVRASINNLPPKCKAIYTLSRFNKYSNREIAEIMEISEKTVENQMTIALRKIRESLSNK